MRKIVWLVCFLAGCPKGGDESLKNAPKKNAGAQSTLGAVKNTTPGPVAEEGGFKLSAKTISPWRVGKPGDLWISLVAKPPYHVNEEYPIEVTTEPSTALTVAKDRLTRSDAQQFDKTSAVFNLQVTPATEGAHILKVKVSFAVCTEQNCVPDERVLAVNVTTGGAS